jgi:peptidoglycan/xylan/chitin deacetylase (PgdA/CDA1 family)
MCLSRRVLLAAPAILSLAATRPATASDAPVEPRMRLANPAPDRLAVALTLDACPGGFDERIATGLVESGIAATIFVTNSWLKRNRAALAFLMAHPICLASRTMAISISPRSSATAAFSALRPRAILPPCSAR